jgi:hypothetical protein
LTQQRLQFITAAVDIADDVERAMLAPLVVVERHALDGDCFHLLRRLQHKDVAEALLGEAPQRPPQLRMLLANHV